MSRRPAPYGQQYCPHCGIAQWNGQPYWEHVAHCAEQGEEPIGPCSLCGDTILPIQIDGGRAVMVDGELVCERCREIAR